LNHRTPARSSAAAKIADRKVRLIADWIAIVVGVAIWALVPWDDVGWALRVFSIGMPVAGLTDLLQLHWSARRTPPPPLSPGKS
jgi:hypothetical protein